MLANGVKISIDRISSGYEEYDYCSDCKCISSELMIINSTYFDLVYCKDCYTKYHSVSSETEPFIPSESIQAMNKKVPIVCRYAGNGCSNISELQHLYAHELTCEYRLVTCYKYGNCDWVGCRNKIDKHILDCHTEEHNNDNEYIAEQLNDLKSQLNKLRDDLKNDFDKLRDEIELLSLLTKSSK